MEVCSKRISHNPPWFTQCATLGKMQTEMQWQTHSLS